MWFDAVYGRAVERRDDRRTHRREHVVALVDVVAALLRGMVDHDAEVVGDRVPDRRTGHTEKGRIVRDLVLDLLDAVAQPGDEPLGLGHGPAQLLLVELEAPLRELDHLTGADHLALAARQPVRGLVHLGRQHRVPAVHLGEEGHPRRRLGRRRGRQQVQDRRAAEHVRLTAALVELGLQEGGADPHDQDPPLELVDALLRGHDVRLGLGDPGREAVHAPLQLPDPPLLGPDLVLGVVQLLLGLLELVVGGCEARQGDPRQARENERGDGSCHDAMGARNGASSGARAGHLDGSNVPAHTHTTTALGRRPRRARGPHPGRLGAPSVPHACLGQGAG